MLEQVPFLFHCVIFSLAYIRFHCYGSTILIDMLGDRSCIANWAPARHLAIKKEIGEPEGFSFQFVDACFIFTAAINRIASFLYSCTTFVDSLERTLSYFPGFYLQGYCFGPLSTYCSCSLLTHVQCIFTRK